MDFSLSEEQTDVRKLAAEILADQTDSEQLKRIEALPERFDEKLWRDLGTAGLLGVAFDESHGGMGFGFETLALLVEEVGRTVAPVPVIPVLVSAALPLDRFGTAEQKDRWLGAVAAGETLLTAALIEPLNDDPTRPTTTAVRVDGAWELTGVKSCVPFAERAERVLVAALAEHGPIAGWLDPRAPGVTLERQVPTAGEPQYLITMDAAQLGDDDLLAAGDAATLLMQWIAERTIAATAAMTVGMTDRMVRMTAEYTSQREQFGVPIATFQAVGHRAADAFIDVECLRLVTQQAVSLLDGDSDAPEAVAIAKIWCGDVAHRVSQASQHLHGGTGVDRDYPLFRYCLWAKQVELTLGSSAEALSKLGGRLAAEFRAAV